MAEKNFSAQGNVPAHVAFIMDGNGRWAKKRHLPRNAGHSAGMNALNRIAEHAMAVGIKYLTVYALSTENMSRPREEIDALFSLLRRYFKEALPDIKKRGGTVRVIGKRDGLPDDICSLIDSATADTAGNSAFHLTIALNYGGRDEIVRAAKRMAEDGAFFDEKTLSEYLDTSGLPDPDLIIRTGGEVRISNFLLWQAAYAELYFTDVLFPDFGDKEFDKALEAYASRDRRYGKIRETPEPSQGTEK